MLKKFNFTREVFHEILFVISLGFTELLFFGLGNWIVASIVFAIFGFAIEIEKRHLSRKVKRDYIDKNWKSLVPNAMVLTVIVFLSCIAAYGAMRSSIMDKIEDMNTLTEMNVASVDPENIKMQIKQIDLEVARLNSSADSAQIEKDKMNSSDGIYISNMINMDNLAISKSSAIQIQMDDRTALTTQLKQIENTEDNKLNQYLSSSNTFNMIADDFNLDLKKVLRTILYTLVVVLEASLFLTVFPLNEENTVEVKKDEKEIVTDYITALFENTSKYLQNDNKVSSATGISLRECKRYRSLLANIKARRGKFLIVKEANGWTSEFTVSFVKSVGIKNLFDSEGE